MRFGRTITAALAAGALTAAAVAAAVFLPADIDAADIRVIDGDTIEWRDEKWRLIGWDAPEISRPKCIGERRKGEAATRRLRAMIDGATIIRIENRQGADFYGRRLATVAIDGQDAGALLAAEGLAKPAPDGHRQDWCTFIWQD